MKNKLLKRANSGFSLVELIVVIAIMAILVGVAVPVYSSYIEKSEISKDKQMVDEVAHALQIYYTANVASNPDGFAGYVVLTKEGTEGGSYADEVGAAAMEATFGANWKTELSLAYDGWTDDGLLSIVAAYGEDDLKAIAGSTFVSVSTPDSMMEAVTNITGLASGVIADSDVSKITTRLNALGMGDIATKLDNLGLDPSKEEDKEAYYTAISNLLVPEMAKMVQDGDGSDNLSAILFMYSSALAYSEATGDDSVLDQIEANLASDAFTFDVLNGDQGACMGVVMNGLMDENGFTNTEFQKFGAQHEANNTQALNAMMGAIGTIAGSYSDKDSLTNPGLYSSEDVSTQVNNYIDAIQALANMDSTARGALTNVPAGSIAIFVTDKGIVSVIPNIA